MTPFQALNHSHKDGEGLTAFQIHRLWQQVFADRYAYGPGGVDHADKGPWEPPTFSRPQMQFLAGAAETLGMICYDAGFYRGYKTKQPGDNGASTKLIQEMLNALKEIADHLDSGALDEGMTAKTRAFFEKHLYETINKAEGNNTNEVQN